MRTLSSLADTWCCRLLATALVHGPSPYVTLHLYSRGGGPSPGKMFSPPLLTTLFFCILVAGDHESRAEDVEDASFQVGEVLN